VHFQDPNPQKIANVEKISKIDEKSKNPNVAQTYLALSFRAFF